MCDFLWCLTVYHFSIIHQLYSYNLQAIYSVRSNSRHTNIYLKTCKLNHLGEGARLRICMYTMVWWWWVVPLVMRTGIACISATLLVGVMCCRQMGCWFQKNVPQTKPLEVWQFDSWDSLEESFASTQLTTLYPFNSSWLRCRGKTSFILISKYSVMSWTLKESTYTYINCTVLDA